MGNAANAQDDVSQENAELSGCNEWEVKGIPLQKWLERNYQLSDAEVEECAQFLIAEEKEPSKQKEHKSFSASVPIAMHNVVGAPAPNPKKTIPCWSYQNRQIFICSWNVGGIVDMGGITNLSEEKREALLTYLTRVISHGCHADMLIFGLQEVVDLSSMKTWLRHPRSHTDRWRKQMDGNIEACLQIITQAANQVNTGVGNKYLIYKPPVYLAGCMIISLVRGGSTDLHRHLSSFSTSDVAVDRFNIGTKGAVSMRFVLHDQSFAFINVHLAASKGRNGNLAKRIQQLKVILDKMYFPVDSGGCEDWVDLDAHHTIFLLGDTNFRIRKGTWDAFAKCSWAKRETGEQNITISRRLKRLSKAFSRQLPTQPGSLFEFDELYNELQKPTALVPYYGCRWTEATVNFAPTFKLCIGPVQSNASMSDIYNSKRVPAWTDRILFRTKSWQTVSATEYNSCKQREEAMGYHFSDHDPVYGLYSVRVRCVDIDALNTRVLQWQSQRTPSTCITVKRELKPFTDWRNAEMKVQEFQLLEMYSNAWSSYLGGRPQYTERQYHILKANLRLKKVDITKIDNTRKKATVEWALNCMRPALDAWAINPKHSHLARFKQSVALVEEAIFNRSDSQPPVRQCVSDERTLQPHYESAEKEMAELGCIRPEISDPPRA